MPATLHCPPRDPGTRLRGKTPQQFAGASLKSINNRELLSNRHRCQSGYGMSESPMPWHCSGQEVCSHLPFLSPQHASAQRAVGRDCYCSLWYVLNVATAISLSEAGSLLSPSLSCLKSSVCRHSSASSQLLRHIGSDNNGSQCKGYKKCPFM